MRLVVQRVLNSKVDGKTYERALDKIGLTLNANAIPNDTMPRFTPSGVRLGTPAITSRGLNEKDMVKIADWMETIAKICAEKRQDGVTEGRLREEVRKMALAHPLPSAK